MIKTYTKKSQEYMPEKFIEQKQKKNCSKLFWFKDLDTQKDLQSSSENTLLYETKYQQKNRY